MPPQQRMPQPPFMCHLGHIHPRLLTIAITVTIVAPCAPMGLVVPFCHEPKVEKFEVAGISELLERGGQWYEGW